MRRTAHSGACRVPARRHTPHAHTPLLIVSVAHIVSSSLDGTLFHFLSHFSHVSISTLTRHRRTTIVNDDTDTFACNPHHAAAGHACSCGHRLRPFAMRHATSPPPPLRALFKRGVAGEQQWWAGGRFQVYPKRCPVVGRGVPRPLGPGHKPAVHRPIV